MLNLSQVTDDSVCTGGQGKQVCGVCNCNGAFTGPECQCMEIGDHCKYVTVRPSIELLDSSFFLCVSVIHN